MGSYHVLVVTNLWPTESNPGYGSFVRAQMESLRPLGVEFDVLFLNGRESLWNYVRGVPQLRRQLRSKTYDLVHAHFGLSGCVALFQSRVPVVVSFMGDDVLGRFKRNGRVSLVGRFFQRSGRFVSRRVAAVIVKSVEMKTALRSSSAHVIPNGVDMNLFQPMERDRARRDLGLALGKKFVLFPFDPAIENKRYDLVEAAVNKARSAFPDLEILVVSGAPRDRMPLYMNAADMLVIASQSEGSPNVVKEAMAVNLPVITVDVGDAASLVESTDGCYVVQREAEAIAAKIVEVCRRVARTIGRNSMERLSMDKVARQIVHVYDQVLGR
ncbi:MAG TPA: glycosyltransferase [Terriglobia bacterium]|nr:glycosyltransferase [Terriglobia bacterium]